MDNHCIKSSHQPPLISQEAEHLMKRNIHYLVTHQCAKGKIKSCLFDFQFHRLPRSFLHHRGYLYGQQET